MNAPPRPPDESRPDALLASILISYAMIVIDNSIVITGLPAIRDGLGFLTTGLSWMQSAHALGFGGLMLLGARAVGLLGRRRVFVAGLAVFTLASLSMGLARSPTWLIASRAVQGAGAAILEAYSNAWQKAMKRAVATGKVPPP